MTSGRRFVAACVFLGAALFFEALKFPIVPIFFTFNAVMSIWSPVPKEYE